MSKRVLTISDLHCGHATGLTPPRWQWHEAHGMEKDAEGHLWGHTEQAARAQAELYEWYLDKRETIGKVDILIHAGDAIDGRAEASRGTELITSDRNKQVAMAHEALSIWEADETYMVYGTPYHTGKGEDFEANLATQLGARAIEDVLWLDVLGNIFDVKHKVGRSSVPYGGFTPLAKEAVWNDLEHLKDEEPDADIFIRAHTHQYRYLGETGWLAIGLPGMQGKGTKYGGRQVVGGIDIGFCWFDIEGPGEYEWHSEIVQLETQRPRVYTAST